MQQTFCDLCKAHIKPGSRGGGIMRTRNIDQIIPMLIPGPNGPGPDMRIDKKDITEVWDLCEECQNYIWEKVNERIKELKRKAEIRTRG